MIHLKRVGAVLVFALFVSSFAFAQSPVQKAEIAKVYDLEKLENLEKRLLAQQVAAKDEVYNWHAKMVGLSSTPLQTDSAKQKSPKSVLTVRPSTITPTMRMQPSLRVQTTSTVEVRSVLISTVRA